MLGSLPEADDPDHDVWLRVSRADAAEIDNLGGWLTTIVARICLNLLRSGNRRRRRREEAAPEANGIVDARLLYHSGAIARGDEVAWRNLIERALALNPPSIQLNATRPSKSSEADVQVDRRRRSMVRACTGFRDCSASDNARDRYGRSARSTLARSAPAWDETEHIVFGGRSDSPRPGLALERPPCPMVSRPVQRRLSEWSDGLWRSAPVSVGSAEPRAWRAREDQCAHGDWRRSPPWRFSAA
jgi:hypothetical protein